MNLQHVTTAGAPQIFLITWDPNPRDQLTWQRCRHFPNLSMLLAQISLHSKEKDWQIKKKTPMCKERGKTLVVASPKMPVREAMAPRVLLSLKDSGKCWMWQGKTPAWETWAFWTQEMSWIPSGFLQNNTFHSMASQLLFPRIWLALRMLIAHVGQWPETHPVTRAGLASFPLASLETVVNQK